MFLFQQLIGHLFSYSRFYELVRYCACVLPTTLLHADGRKPSSKALPAINPPPHIKTLMATGCSVLCSWGIPKEVHPHGHALPAGIHTSWIPGFHKANIMARLAVSVENTCCMNQSKYFVDEWEAASFYYSCENWFILRKTFIYSKISECLFCCC